ncbi:MAG: sulfatase-like hydrolase/transferase [Wenzhouxiangella sp.]
MKSAITPAAARPIFQLLLWGLFLNLLLIVPLWVRFGFDSGARWVAWEAWVLVALFALMPNHGLSRSLRWLVAGVVLTALILGLGHGATHQILARPLNVYFDINLISASFHLLEGNLGWAAAVAIAIGSLIFLLALLLVLGRALKPGTARSLATVSTAAALGVSALVFSVLEIRDQRTLQFARTPAWDTLRFQLDQVRTTHRARQEFIAAAPASPRPASAMPGLAQADVLLVFVESYGATVLELDRFREVVVPTLERQETRLREAGLSMATGLLEAPIRGGQSWLAHATTLSGRWIDNQLWYRLLLDSHRNSLIDDFRATGHETMAVMPAITMAWPEGRQHGWDRIYAARDLGYAGPPLNWVTMPDQFTLDRFQRTLRPNAPRPLFAQIALISSHAPWTPIIDVEDDWDAIGDGQIFERWRNSGDPPQVLWQDMERVRDHFAMSVEYSMHVSLEWAARFLDDDTLLILVGDHQPAAVITGHEASGAVPVHIISRNPELVEPFRQRGFIDGLIPDYPAPAPRMSELRGWLNEDFGG